MQIKVTVPLACPYPSEVLLQWEEEEVVAFRDCESSYKRIRNHFFSEA